MEENFELFKKLILMHSVESPTPLDGQTLPPSAIFDFEDVSVITDFVAKTFYRQDSWHKCIFITRLFCAP
jgi:hypothetical protein